MVKKKFIDKPNFSFKFDEILELNLKRYLDLRKKKEILGGLIGDIKGGSKNRIVFDIKDFLPLPNTAEDPKNFARPPIIWFEILEEWRTFHHKDYKFIGFLHSHPLSSSRISVQDEKFAKFLETKYGSIVFIIIGGNKSMRSYLFNSEGTNNISGKVRYYKLLKR